jgi:hypothetical protein
LNVSWALVTLLAFGILQGCQTTNPVPESDHPFLKRPPRPGSFPHELFDGALKKFNRGGFVDYELLLGDRVLVDAYLRALSRVNPKSQPQLFPEAAQQQCYWINGYNALVFQNILKRYPFKDLEGALKQNVFYRQEKFQIGGELFSLWELENEVLAKDFARDPRIHFVLNNGTYSAPRLPEDAFRASGLDGQLRHETEKFLSEERNVKVKEHKGQILLSSIFKWYREDFINDPSVVNACNDGDERLVGWLNRYLPRGRQIPERLGGWEIKYRDYDWRLNDRKSTSSDETSGG